MGGSEDYGDRVIGRGCKTRRSDIAGRVESQGDEIAWSSERSVERAKRAPKRVRGAGDDVAAGVCPSAGAEHEEPDQPRRNPCPCKSDGCSPCELSHRMRGESHDRVRTWIHIRAGHDLSDPSHTRSQHCLLATVAHGVKSTKPIPLSSDAIGAWIRGNTQLG